MSGQGRQSGHTVTLRALDLNAWHSLESGAGGFGPIDSDVSEARLSESTHGHATGETALTGVLQTIGFRYARAHARRSTLGRRVALWTLCVGLAAWVGTTPALAGASDHRAAPHAPDAGQPTAAQAPGAGHEVGDGGEVGEVAGVVGSLPILPADRILRAQSEALLGNPAALLRAASEAIEQEDFSHADWLYAQLMARHPIVGDHTGLRRARLQLEMGRAKEARAIAERTLSDFTDSPLRAELHELVGEALVASRNEAGAREAWAAALSETQDDEQRAALLRRVARSEERSGEDRAAAVTWRLLWYAHPASHEAKQASHRLDVIEAHLDEQIRRASDWRRRGDRLFRERMNDEALEAYDHALEMGLSASEVRRAQKQRAQTLFRMRRYPPKPGTRRSGWRVRWPERIACPSRSPHSRR